MVINLSVLGFYTYDPVTVKSAAVNLRNWEDWDQFRTGRSLTKRTGCLHHRHHWHHRHHRHHHRHETGVRRMIISGLFTLVRVLISQVQSSSAMLINSINYRQQAWSCSELLRAAHNPLHQPAPHPAASPPPPTPSEI